MKPTQILAFNDAPLDAIGTPLKNGGGFVMNTTPAIFVPNQNLKERLMIRFLRRPGLFIAPLVVLSLSFAIPTHAKRALAAKKTEPAHASRNQKASNPSQGSQGQPASPKDALHCEAKAAVLMDAMTGQLLYEQDPDVKIPPASFVKVLTLHLIYDALKAGQLKLEDTVTISEKAWRIQGSKMFVKVGDRVRVDDLMKGIAIDSGNDACIAMAEHLAGSEEVFVSKMNEKAKLIGMKNSEFKNSNGMPAEGQVVSAMDMAVLAKRYIEDHPEALALHSQTEFEYNGIRQGNRNVLLYKNIGVDGLKTGHIEESGYHLVATAKREGQRMIAVLMGCGTYKIRGPETQKLLEYGFRNFATVEAIKKGAAFGPIKVKRGKLKEVGLLAAEDVRVTVARGKEKSVSTLPQLPESVAAPIQKGQVLAKALVQNEGKTVKEIGLLAANEVEKSLLPPLPILIGGIVGLLLIAFVVFWFLRRQRKYT
jgi:serine-type D-Ala-D-Ala carboxypeptidase (penicillin-binding protein 5/6)